jgi:hypothetical protein
VIRLPRRCGRVEVPALFRVRVAPAVPHELYTLPGRSLWTGAAGVSPVLRRLSACLPWPEDSGGPTPPRPCGGARVAFGSVQTLGVRHERSALSKLSQHCRGHGSPCGLQETLSTLRPSCAPCVSSRLRHGRKTRYGWVAGPSPTRTCTLQETPSLSWRENAGRQARLEAGAERSDA